ncbi:MAG: isochorismatase family protein [Actinobacteria bacterium]|nr:isochorismatase family protein [Actinomycetota bacterium]
MERHGHGGGTYRLAGERGWGYDPGRTALLVIDPVNDFLSEDGAGWSMTESTVSKHDVVGHLRQAIDVAREQGIPVLYAPMAFTAEDYEDQELQRKTGIGRIMFERRMFLAGTWGADFHPELTPADDEVILQPHKVNDVFETDLPDHLERLGTTQLVIAGMTANLCCEATGRHASEHGYDVTFLRDAIGAENLPAYEASIRVNYPLIANAVMDVEDFAAVLRAGGRAPQEGDDVIASDQLKIGSVDEVVVDADAGTGYLKVGRSIFASDPYLPLDAVVKVGPDKVFVNLPKLVIGEMPWDQPPSAESRRDKVGPRADAVTGLYGELSPRS